MWWIIIGAVIALVVMIILMVMFTGKSNKLEIGLMSCEGKGGTCLTKTVCKSEQYSGTVSIAFDCPPELNAPVTITEENKKFCCFTEK